MNEIDVMISTKNQTRANDFDLDLFRLTRRASDFACKDQTHSQAQRNEWAHIERDLRRIRPLVRAIMHPTDRANTA